MSPIHKKFHYGLLLGLIFGFNLAAQAYSLFRAESESLLTVQQNEKKQMISPFYEFISTSYLTDKKDFVVESNFSFYTEPLQDSSQKDFKLYLLSVKKEVIPDLMSIKVGRTLDIENSIGPASLDMLSSEFYFMNKQLRVGGYLGVERPLDGAVDKPSNDIWGTHLQYYTNDMLPYMFNLKFVQKTYSNNNPSKENFLDFSTKKSFNVTWNPEWLFDAQYNASESHLDRLDTGVNLFPSIRSHAQVRVMSFDLLPITGREPPVFSIFSLGRLSEARILWENQVHPQWITSFSLFGDDYLIQENQRTQGTGFENEWRYLMETGILSNVLYYFKSYGGYALGYRIRATHNIEKKSELYLLGDMTYYEKITSSHRSAFNSEVGWSRYLDPQWKLSFAGEVNSNNTIQYDFRVIAKLLFVFWRES